MIDKEKQINKQGRVRYLFYFLFAILYLIPVIIILLKGSDNTLHFIRRLTGLAGLTSLFIAILLSLLVKESKKIFGVYYLKIHHFFSIMGLILISLHPVIMAIDFGTTRIFIPNFHSWSVFITNAGRPALYLIYMAVIAALWRKNIAQYWKYIHYLLYPAFLLAAIHGITSGSDLDNPVLLIQFIAMISVVIIIFCYKRFQNIKNLSR